MKQTWQGCLCIVISMIMFPLIGPEIQDGQHHRIYFVQRTKDDCEITDLIKPKLYIQVQDCVFIIENFNHHMTLLFLFTA